MGFVNKVFLMGNTTRDPQLRQLPSGTAVCDFGMAVNRVFKTPNGEERQETVFVDCTSFGRQGEVIAEYCPKGRALFIEGRLHFESWEDTAGNRRSKLTVIVESFQFIGSRDGGAGGGTQRELYEELDIAPARGGVRKVAPSHPPHAAVSPSAGATTAPRAAQANGGHPASHPAVATPAKSPANGSHLRAVPPAPNGKGKPHGRTARGKDAPKGRTTAETADTDQPSATEAEELESADLPF